MTGQAVVTVAVVVVIVFLLVRLIPGDPAKVILGVQYTPAAGNALRAQLHLDQPLPEQFLLYVQGLLRGDLGNSSAQPGRTVVDVIGAALPATAAVALTGIIFGLIFGVILGMTAAITKRPVVDFLVRVWSMLTFSVPGFLVGLLLILLFALSLNLLPAGGWPGSWPANIPYLILPGLTLSITLSTLTARTVRQAAIDTQGQSFIEAAYARGLPARILNFRHVLPNSILPAVTLVGISFGTLLTGAIIVESVFGIPGLGQQMSQAVSARDYPVIQGVALISAVVVVVSGYLVEIVYTLKQIVCVKG